MEKQIENLKEELSKALSDDRHNLKESLEDLMNAFEQYKLKVIELEGRNKDLIDHAETIQNINKNLMETLRLIHTVLTANLEKVKEMKHGEDLLKVLSQFVISTDMVKGMVK